MKKILILILPLFLNASIYYGVIVSKIPNNGEGIWKIGNRDINVTDITEFNEKYKKFKKGNCVKVKIDDDDVDEIISTPLSRCK